MKLTISLPSPLWPTEGLVEDLHVHSTFSDGEVSQPELVERAREIGLVRLGLVDHVRPDTPWLEEFVGSANALRAESSTSTSTSAPAGPELEILAGVEASIVDLDGNLDLPTDLDGIDFLLAADHQIPGEDGPREPSSVREEMEAGRLQPAAVILDIIDASRNCLRRYPGVVLAHLFSVLPKIGLCEADVPMEWVEDLAITAAATGGRIEVNERWKCPGPDVVACFLAHGVAVHTSSDAHRVADLGQFSTVDACLKAATRHGEGSWAELLETQKDVGDWSPVAVGSAS